MKLRKEILQGDCLEVLSDLPDGSYHVQVVLNVYETFERADGHVVKVPADDGERCRGTPGSRSVG